MNTKSTNSTFKITSKFEQRLPEASNSRSGKVAATNPMFRSLESTEQQTVKSKASVVPSQVARVKKFQVSRFTNSTLDFAG